MTQHQILQLFLPIVILVPVLYFRMRRMTRAQPLRLDRLWIRPAIFLAITALVLLAPPPHNHPERVLVALDFAWLALAGALGAVAGWQMGRTMAIDVHPENGTLITQGGQAAMMLLVVLILFRLVLREGLSVEAQAWHINMLLVSDASIVFIAVLYVARSVEMYLRARRVMAVKATA
jgi:hypothetical protein